MKRVGVTACLGLASLFTCVTSAIAQSRCADCHFANRAAPAAAHLSNWNGSAHSRNSVGCEKCHGGDATTFEPFLAHRGILNSTDPASPVNRRNLPTTCGTCHTGPFVAFQRSQHFALLKDGDTRVPACSTCHDAAGTWRPSARSLETECRQCHGFDGIEPRAGRAEAARKLYEVLHESRDLMKSAKSLINRVDDKAQQAQLNAAYQQTEVPLVEAVQAGHQFAYDDLKERLSTARRRLDALLGQLASPKR